MMRTRSSITSVFLLSAVLVACGQGSRSTVPPTAEDAVTPVAESNVELVPDAEAEQNQAAGELQAQELYTGTRTTPVQVYYDVTVANFGYTGAYDRARADWSNRSGRIGNLPKATSKGPTTDIYKVYNDPNNTNYGYYNGNVAYLNNNWDYASVRINHYQIQNATATLTPTQNADRTTRHELGHSFKLDHTAQASIMNVNVGYTSVQSFDVSELLRKWGY